LAKKNEEEVPAAAPRDAAAPQTGKAARVALIKRIQQERKSSVVTYITSTRPNLDVQMSLDVVRYVFDHLESIRKAHKGTGKPAIDLFLHSNGGDGTMPWRLVTLIREYTDRFGVLVPYRAFSAATLAALGADEVVMHPMASR
jgi:ClpP class serine protease